MSWINHEAPLYVFFFGLLLLPAA